MNPIKKAYCRVFQFAFRVAIPFLPYRKPGQLSSMEELPALLKKKNVKSVLLVTDGFLRESGATAHLEEILAKNDIYCAVYDKTRPNPTVKNVEAATAIYN